MKDDLTLKNIKRRVKAPVNPFWKKVQIIGGAVSAIALGLLAAPIALPVAVTTGLTILATLAGTAVSVATVTTSDNKEVEGDGDAK